MDNWKPIFDGTIDGRPVTLKEWKDDEGRQLQVETNYGEDQILGDGIPGVIGVPVSADDKMLVDASTPDELERNLIEQGGFSPAGAKEIARHAWLP
ncbi:hypothetical protein [Cupriavidus necator]|uniref:hypothetical protein n=1 Tax=Cupriavidus necator TaxID=106590 RepID=UPI0005B45008|nr:hypothetical protein [Cupriavidus necator]